MAKRYWAWQKAWWHSCFLQWKHKWSSTNFVANSKNHNQGPVTWPLCRCKLLWMYFLFLVYTYISVSSLLPGLYFYSTEPTAQIDAQIDEDTDTSEPTRWSYPYIMPEMPPRLKSALEAKDTRFMHNSSLRSQLLQSLLDDIVLKAGWYVHAIM